ncbi:PilZ domain-containing protein, partial [Sphingomonas sp.]|uniref:PilZ domain-containing protein n=1 Tax=Sphingomonas sp. TaxID=28214 RepID=UPI0025CBC502
SPVPSPQEQDAYADRRVYPRVAVALPAFLQAGRERHHVQMLDLSAGGARLQCAARLPNGTAVELDCGTFVRPGGVRWQNEEALGLSFDSELNARELSALVNRSNALTARMNPAD